MTARTTMANLILELRRRCDAGTADYSLGSETFWSDDHLQAVLDRNRTPIRREKLTTESEYSGGSVAYRDYGWRYGPWVEALDGGTAWRLEDSAGSALGTASYTPEYGARTLRFSADTGGTAYYLSYRVYDLDRAAADVWEDKAAGVANRFDLKTDNHDLKRSQLVAQYKAMAESFRRRAPARVATRFRGDLGFDQADGWDA